MVTNQISLISKCHEKFHNLIIIEEHSKIFLSIVSFNIIRFLYIFSNTAPRVTTTLCDINYSVNIVQFYI